MNENVGINFLGSIYGHGTGYAGCVFGKDGLSPSITANSGGTKADVNEEKMGGGQTPVFTERYRTHYRIRKLTPRECGRLMGVKDSDIDKMAAVNSNSQLYKQFGNSIVVDVMYAMFRKLNIKGVS